MRPHHATLLALGIAATVLAITAAGPAPGSRPTPALAGHADSAATASNARQVELDLDRASAITLPALTKDLEATAFRTADGRGGWALRIPGGRPIATPAYADGRIFVGGGYGSNEFYAFDAATGKVAWQIHTSDDGPTAAVVEDGCVAFNTESCTVMVVNARDGKLLWQEWLGDPLMSQPAIQHGRLYIGFPANPRGPQATAGGKLGGDESRWQHRLLCADLRTGRHLWVRPIPAPVISAPVIAGNQILLACFDGTSLRMACDDGRVTWRERNGATSAPIVADGQVVVSEKHFRGGRAMEGMAFDQMHAPAGHDTTMVAASQAPYLNLGSGQSSMIASKAQAELDQSVGFGDAAGVALMGAPIEHLAVGTVAGGWAYQGSRAASRGGNVLNAQGQYLNCVTAADKKVAWQAKASGAGVTADAQLFAPPALGKKNAYLCSARGHIVSLRQRDGSVVFAYALGQPMAFQPALANGNLYAGTSNGLLVCLNTGDPDADGWHAWGGNAQHNKSE